MLDFVKRLFGKGTTKREFTEEEREQHHKAKQAGLERLLGPMNPWVTRLIVGDAVTMCYFPNCGIPGTAFATTEFIQPDGSGPKPNRIGTYEFVAFTRQPLPPTGPGQERDFSNPFWPLERQMCGIFTLIGNYSLQAVLSPGETCEIPGDDEGSTHCLVFDEYNPNGAGFFINGKRHCLLLCMEIHRSEMNYALQQGGERLLALLKARGHYPYSNLDRPPVVQG